MCDRLNAFARYAECKMYALACICVFIAIALDRFSSGRYVVCK